MPLPAETIAFYQSGLVHQFGNLLLTIQGNAMALGRGPIERPRDAILAASARGAASLEILRALLGQRTSGVTSAQELLRQLLELSRIPVRERGWTTRLGTLPEEPVMVATTPFLQAAASGVRWLATMVPEGTAGLVELRLRRGGARDCSLRLSFEPAAGSLPFPLPIGELLQALAAEVPHSVSVRAESGVNGVELRFEVGAGGILASRSQEA